MSSPVSIMLIAGIALMAVGIFGGGVEVKEIKIPPLSILPRAASFAVGSILTVWVVTHGLGNTRDEPEVASRRDDVGPAIEGRLTSVRDVKSNLKELGMYAGPITPDPVLAYFVAVGNFQQSRNIGSNGLVDAATLAELQKAVSELHGKQQAASATPASGPAHPVQKAGPAAPPQIASASTQPAEFTTRDMGAGGPAVSEQQTQSIPLCKILPNRKPRPSPGVNCTATGTPDEVQICANTELCDLDWQLYSFYQVKKASLDKGQQDKLSKDESAWVRKRGDCRDTPCIASAYRSRIDQLR